MDFQRILLSKTSFILLSKDLVQTLEMDAEINLWREKGHCSNSGPTVTTTLRWVDKIAPQPLPIGIGSTHNCFTPARTASRPWNTATVTVFCFHVVAVNISQLLSFQLNLFSWLAFLDVAMYVERPIFRETGIAFGQWNTKSIRLTDSGPGIRSLG